MTWLLGKWVALGVVGTFLIAWGSLQTYRLRGAESERDLARAHVEQVTAAFEGEKIAVGAAVSANAQNDKLLRDQGERCGTALDGSAAALATCRAQVRKCVTDDAVADRLGTLYP